MIKKSVITLGTFDGIHKGHKLLINKTLSVAKKNNLKSMVILLKEPVKKVSGLLTTYEEKLDEIKSFGVDEIIVIEVPSIILSHTHDEFFDNFLSKTLRVSEIVCGSNFAFGKNRKGDIKWLHEKAKNSGIKIDIVELLKNTSKQAISSSYIRTLIEKSDVVNAAKLLGRNYSFIGIPFREKGMGKKLGFPTLNLRVAKNKLLPKGVYTSFISQGERIYPSVTNIGIRITFNRGDQIVPETHILNFQGNLKKSQIKVVILKKIRDEEKFVSIEKLKSRIFKDVSIAMHFFNKK
ncbi:MAG: riboflavin biosynthesis protein RibF [Endomicrobium sp.]|jgi:riboflavin kinase/FMN adenylyltransferase|nr:riboflavin biosynthesis protein RibF [Endomicrobium sp.]